MMMICSVARLPARSFSENGRVIPIPPPPVEFGGSSNMRDAAGERSVYTRFDIHNIIYCIMYNNFESSVRDVFEGKDCHTPPAAAR